MVIRKQPVFYMIFLVHAQGYAIPTLENFDQLHDAKLPKYNWSHEAFTLKGETYRFNAEKMADDNSKPIMYSYQYATRDLRSKESTVKLVNVRTAAGKILSCREFCSVVPDRAYDSYWVYGEPRTYVMYTESELI